MHRNGTASTLTSSSPASTTPLQRWCSGNADPFRPSWIVNDSSPVLLVSHGRKQRCGIYQFGAQLAIALRSSKRYAFSYMECSDEGEYRAAMAQVQPALIIHNYSQTTMPWLRRGIMRRARAAQVGVIHEVTQAVADGADDSL